MRLKKAQNLRIFKENREAEERRRALFLNTTQLTYHAHWWHTMRAFSYFLFARACIIVMYIQLTLDAYFILTVIILFSLPILTFVQ